jgi:hypothetical protein
MFSFVEASLIDEPGATCSGRVTGIPDGTQNRGSVRLGDDSPPTPSNALRVDCRVASSFGPRHLITKAFEPTLLALAK